MKFKVRNGKAERLIGILGIIVFSVLMAGMAALGIQTLLEGHKDIFYCYLFFATIIGALDVLSFYVIIRPRANVDGDMVVFYPKAGKKRMIDINGITKKVSLPRKDQTAPMGGLIGGLMWYGVTGGQQGVSYDYAYLSGSKEVMRINDRMENAYLLDKIITEKLHAKQKPAEGEEE